MFSKIEELTKQTALLDDRLDWDEYFMSIALLASCRSPCLRICNRQR
jgi:deoxycytidylate deaminase